jgi:Na+/melibiose symporter-like transporter
VIFTIKGILGFSSIILLVPSIVLALRWTLTKERHALLIGYLDRKRSGIEVSPEEESEIKEILKPLI